jgi:beta-xylosidase
VFLWKSKDLATWEEVGLVWGYEDVHGRAQLRWVTQWQPVHNRPGERLGHALAGAELHAVKGKWVIAFSKNRWHGGLLAADAPAGPFRFIEGYPWDSKPPARSLYGSGPVSPHSFMMAGDPSLFTDADGAVYMVWGPGWIVKLNESLDRWAEEPRSLQAAIEGWPNADMPAGISGENGACVLLKGGRYYFAFAAESERGGKRRTDTWVCGADKLFGPYSKPSVLIEGGGQAKFFEDETGLYASCSLDGAPVIVPVDLK